MTANITHKEKLVGVPNNPDDYVSADAWRADHDVTGLVENVSAGNGITIDYTNPLIPIISLYTSPNVSLSGGSIVEIGSTVANVNLSWSCNKTMVSRILSSPVPVIDQNQGAGGNGSYTHIGANLTTDTTYSITVNDGTNNAFGSTNVSFFNRRYYGVNVNTSLTNSDVLSLSKEFCYGVGNTHSYNCTGGRYIWICYPANYGTATFVIGGLETTFTLTIQDVTNDSGYTESFNLYRSSEIQNGSDITVVVN